MSFNDCAYCADGEGPGVGDDTGAAVELLPSPFHTCAWLIWRIFCVLSDVRLTLIFRA